MNDLITNLSEVRTVIQDARNLGFNSKVSELDEMLDKLARCDFGYNDHDESKLLERAEARLLNFLLIKQDRAKYEQDRVKFGFAVRSAYVGWVLTIILLMVNIFK